MKALFAGLTTIDIQYFVEEFPGSNVKIKSNPPEINIGGPATNAAVAFSFLSGNAGLVSAIGENPFKTIISEDFNNTGIIHNDLIKNEKENPVLATVITSGSGERNIFTHNPQKIEPKINVLRLINDLTPEIILIDGFYPEFSLDLVKTAHKKNIPVILDGGSWKTQYQTILPYVNYAICSNDFLPPHCKTSNDVFAYIKNSGVKYAAITRGEKPVLFSCGANVEEIEITKTEAIDTLGAGDFFHGAFAFYTLKNNDFKTALQKASKLATTTCLYPGTRKWLKFVNRIHFL